MARTFRGIMLHANWARELRVGVESGVGGLEISDIPGGPCGSVYPPLFRSIINIIY